MNDNKNGPKHQEIDRFCNILAEYAILEAQIEFAKLAMFVVLRTFSSVLTQGL